MTVEAGTIDKLQDRLNRALLSADWQTLTALVAEPAVIIGPKGYQISRETWIGVHQEEAYEQLRLEVVESQTHGYDGTGIRVDVIDSECRFHGELITGRFRVCQTWAQDEGRWQLAAIQYTTAA